MNAPAHISVRRQQLARLDLFARAAMTRPHDEASARRYATFALELNDRDAAIAALEHLVKAVPDDAIAWCRLSEALLYRNRTHEAAEAGRIAAQLAADSAFVLATYGFALRAEHRDDEADRVFERAIAADPLDRNAARGHGQALIRKGEFAALKRHIETVFESIGPISWMVAQYMIALAMLGNHRTLAKLIDYDRHVATVAIETPAGFASLEEFNAALLAEMEAIACDNGGVSLDVLRNGQRIEGGPLRAVDMLGPQGAPASAALVTQAETRLAGYLDGIGDAIPVRLRPDSFVVSTDAIISDHQTCLAAHTHANSWMNMVYYLAVPDCIKSRDPAGCMEFCPPTHKANIPANCWPSHVVIPHTGRLALFPGYLCHRVNALAAPGRRASIAFDIFPAQDPHTNGSRLEDQDQE